MAQSIPSVPLRPPEHLPFFLEQLKMSHGGAGGFIQEPHVGALKKCVQMPHPGTTLKLHFPVNKLQLPYLTVQY